MNRILKLSVSTFALVAFAGYHTFGARKTVADAVSKWQTRVSQSGAFYQAGVQNPQVDWAGPAVAAKDRRDQGLLSAIADGRIDAGIQRAGTQKWRTNTVAKGVSAWTQNTPKAAPQYGAGLTKVYTYFSAADAAVANMPRTTRQDRIQRGAAFLNAVGEAADAAKAMS